MSDNEKQPKSRAVIEPTHPAPEFFFDGVANIGLSGGVIRIDFAHLSPAARDDQGQPLLERNVRLITSIEGFVATYQTMQRMVDRLAAQGKLTVAPARR